MAVRTMCRVGAVAVGAASALLATTLCAAAETTAAETTAAVHREYSVGLACPGFRVGVDEIPSANGVTTEYTNASGKRVVATSGTGASFFFKSRATGKTFSVKGAAATSTRTYEPDGSFTAVLSGQNVIILSPDAVPAGPSINLYKGPVVIEADANGVSTITKAPAPTLDICTKLD
jgi:hypothetical protein